MARTPAQSPDAASRWPSVWYWMKVTAGVLVVIALARTVSAIGNVITLVVVSLVLAIGFQPAVAWLTRRRLSRGWAVALIFLTGFGVVALFLALVLPSIIREIGELVADAPALVQRAQRESGFLADLNERFQLDDRLRSLAADLPTTVLSLVRSFTTLVFNALTVLILTLYFTTAMPRMVRGVAALLRPGDREDFERILDESTQRVGGYVLGNIAVSVIAGVVTFVVLAVIGVPYPAALGFWVALTDLIPTVGALLGALVAGTVAAFSGLGHLIGTLVFFLVYQQVENYVIAPRVMRKAIDMSAGAVIVAVLIGGSLAGIVGALLALPVAAIIKVAVRALYLEPRLEEVGSS